DYYDGRLSRRAFVGRLVATGLSAAAARSVVEAADLGSLPGAPASAGIEFAGTGGELLVEQVKAAGSRYLFTNPGSLEVAFFDALVDRPELELVVGLHEGIVIAMADGYHKASRQPAFVNVHAAVGTAQMAGQMYNAHFDGSGLVVTAGMSDNTVGSDDMVLAPRPGFSQSEINRQFTKIAWDVRTGASSALAIRRAYKLAGTAPGGPVYVAFSTRALSESVKAEVFPRDAFLVEARPRAAVDQVEAAARMLVEAKRPVVLLGDEVYKADAAEAAVALCEMLGLPIVTPNLPAFNYLSATNPLYLGTRFGGGSSYPYGDADLVLQMGSRESGGAAGPEGPAARYIAVGLDTNMLGRTRALDLAVVGDVRVTARELADAVRSMVTADRLARLRDERLGVITPATAAARAARLERARTVFNQSVIHPDQVGYEMEQGLERNALLVTENAPGLQGKHDFLSYGPGPDQKQNIGHGGGSLGWGVGAAVGAKLGAPDRQVVLSIGDGSVMYSASGFWSLARHSTAVLTIVWNNRNYQTVRNGAYRYNKRMVESGKYPGLYLGDPDIDFVKLAESQGVKGMRVTSAADVAAALRKGTAETRAGNPYLIEFVVSRIGGGAESTWYQKVRPAAATPPTSVR
ncbi:MAG: thiamine pyrophosphate-binding protein, partial [Acidobacteriota bacterium]|nr:thiamine pyrophosphate-binding protein [Acidobacteriota bacterium]